MERDRTAAYLSKLAAEHNIPVSGMLASSRIWQDFAHAMFNFKEFIYVF